MRPIHKKKFDMASSINSLCNSGNFVYLNGNDLEQLNQKIASFEDFIAVPAIPSLLVLRQHVSKLPGLLNEFVHNAMY